jgi:hypothetical protein
MKFLIFILAVFALVAVTSCYHHKKSDPFSVESVTKADAKYVNDTYGENNCKWYETQIGLKNYLDGDYPMEIEFVETVFQAVVPTDSTSYDTYVVRTAHQPDGSEERVISHDFWIEDAELVGLFLSFETAYNKLMEANCPKPHSRYCVLRKELGPISTNAQYIFGNSEQQVYVDAVTGNVSLHNPVYPNED